MISANEARRAAIILERLEIWKTISDSIQGGYTQCYVKVNNEDNREYFLGLGYEFIKDDIRDIITWN